MPYAATKIYLEIIIPNEISQTEKDKSQDITNMWNLKKIQMNLYTKQKQTHSRRKQTYGYQSGK